MPEIAAAPPTIAGVGQIYVKAADGFPYFKDSAGAETLLLPTREFFAVVFQGNDIPGQYGARIDGGGDTCAMMVLIPQDFTSLDALEVIFTPVETGVSMHFNINTYYGAYNGGENHNVHTENDTGGDIGATVANQNLAHSIAHLVDANPIVAGDLLHVRVQYNATAIDSNAWVKGIRLKYS